MKIRQTKKQVSILQRRLAQIGVSLPTDEARKLLGEVEYQIMYYGPTVSEVSPPYCSKAIEEIVGLFNPERS